jgi:hypothetical protein
VRGLWSKNARGSKIKLINNSTVNEYRSLSRLTLTVMHLHTYKHISMINLFLKGEKDRGAPPGVTEGGGEKTGR